MVIAATSEWWEEFSILSASRISCIASVQVPPSLHPGRGEERDPLPPFKKKKKKEYKPVVGLLGFEP